MLLLDIEGTTTPLDFVHAVLFPFAAARLEGFLAAHRGDTAVDEARRLVLADASPAEAALGGDAAVLAVVRRQMAADAKAGGLKRLQGLVWQDGYASGALRAPVYDDVPVVLRREHAAGRPAAIFSSGSVLAQQLLFRHSAAGDLSPLISAHFDTGTGPKREPASYAAIARALGCAPAAITFASDRPEETAAALAAGCRAALVLRPGNPPLPAGLPCAVHPDLTTVG